MHVYTTLAMPRPPKKGNEDNPLRRLRDALGTDQAPIPQHELAELLNLSPETVKSIEAGRRSLTEKLLEWIYVNLGAYWSERQRTWTSIGSREPFTREASDRWRQAGLDRDLESHSLMLRLMLLLEYAPEEKFKQIADTVEAKLQEVLLEFDYRPDNKDVDWFNTQLRIVP